MQRLMMRQFTTGSKWRTAAAVAACAGSLLLALPAAHADGSGPAKADQPADKPATYAPQVGQAGKDVVWVPTPQALVDRMLDMAKVTPSDYLIDLGSGDGRTVITAARRGLDALGIEYNPDMVELARRNAAAAGVSAKAKFEKADLFETSFDRAQVITMFLLPTINARLMPKLLDLKPGTRVVSNTFNMGTWEPDETSIVDGDCTSWCTALMWIVPAKVAGHWRLGPQTLELDQQAQMLTGKLGGAEISEGRMRGSDIEFSVNGTRYMGTVSGRSMKGTGGAHWSATRM